MLAQAFGVVQVVLLRFGGKYGLFGGLFGVCFAGVGWMDLWVSSFVEG